METTGELNSRAWYRLLKVIYVLFFILIFILSFFSGYFATEPQFDNKNSYIRCDSGSELKPTEIGITLYGSYISLYEAQKIDFLCLTNYDIGAFAQSVYPEYKDLSAEEVGQKIRNKTINDSSFDFYKQVKFNKGIYTLISVYTKRNWFEAIGISLLSILAACFFYELIKRVFYYIILGSFRPKK